MKDRLNGTPVIRSKARASGTMPDTDRFTSKSREFPMLSFFRALTPRSQMSSLDERKPKPNLLAAEICLLCGGSGKFNRIRCLDCEGSGAIAIVVNDVSRPH